MCKCSPEVKTPFCGKLGCEWPQQRPRGKSRMNELVRAQFEAMGMKPCPHCAVQGKWDIFHAPGHPCPHDEMVIIGVDEATPGTDKTVEWLSESAPITEEVWRTLDDPGHDPDLDENGVCRVCGKYEPE